MINNQSELNNAIMLRVSIALEYSIGKLLDELKSNIDRIIYGAGTPKRYERTMEFEESWETSKPIIKGLMAESTLFQNAMGMSLGFEQHQHSSVDFTTGEITDNRQQLADMIFNGWGYDFGGSNTTWYNQARDAWTPTIECLDNGKFMVWFNEGMRL